MCGGSQPKVDKSYQKWSKEEAERARAEEEARQNRIDYGMEQIRAIFEGGNAPGTSKVAASGAYNPNTTYYNADGSVWTPAAQTTRTVTDKVPIAGRPFTPAQPAPAKPSSPKPAPQPAPVVQPKGKSNGKRRSLAELEMLEAQTNKVALDKAVSDYLGRPPRNESERLMVEQHVQGAGLKPDGTARFYGVNTDREALENFNSKGGYFSAKDGSPRYYNPETRVNYPASDWPEPGGGGVVTPSANRPNPSSPGSAPTYRTVQRTVTEGLSPAEQFAAAFRNLLTVGQGKKYAGMDPLLDARREAQEAWYYPALAKNRSEAEDELTFALSRAGLTRSTAANTSRADLAEDYDLEKAQVASNIERDIASTRSSINNQRQQLEATLRASGDATASTNAALAARSTFAQDQPELDTLENSMLAVAQGIGAAANGYQTAQIRQRARGGSTVNRDRSRVVGG
ncbi:MAG: hypothetical protein KAX54_00310 [Thauera sp.]|nr:hypothetical protein [Thauera sp.]